MRISEKYFKDLEIACKGVNCGCGNKVILDSLFDAKIFRLRESLQLPMKVNSGCRCWNHNKAVGGAFKSFHISDKPAWRSLGGTAAFDIAYSDKSYRNTLAMAAWQLGFRIGFNKKFLHLDSAAHHKLLPQTIFKYDNVTDAELIKFQKEIIGK